MEPLILILPPHASTAAKPYAHLGEEFGYVLKGEVSCLVAGNTYRLQEGDSIYFKSTLLHLIENPTNSEVSCIWVSMPPRNRW